MSSVAPKRPAAMPPPVLVALDTTSPVLVTTVTVEVEVAESTERTIRIGMAPDQPEEGRQPVELLGVVDVQAGGVRVGLRGHEMPPSW